MSRTAWPSPERLKRMTHLGIGAHQDDLEFMAFRAFWNVSGTTNYWFGGVTCTNGAGSARVRRICELTDAQMMAIRRHEQNAAATIGRYGAMIQLDYPSSAVKSPAETR